MRRVLKWLAYGLGGIVGLAILGAAYIYGTSEYAIRRHYDIPVSAFAAPKDTASVERGERVAILSGCYHGCHGKDMEGLAGLVDWPGVAHINAPNLTRVLREYSDAELERLLRHGVKRDGTTAWVMPSAMFMHLSEQDLADLVAFVQSVPEQEGIPRDFTVGPFGRFAIATGKFKPVVEQVDHSLPRVATGLSADPLERGKYLVKTTCTECHGQSLEGSELVKSPNLAIVQAYSEEDFFRLMRTGRGLGDRDLGLMSEVAVARFSLFSDEEVRAVRGYLLDHAQSQAVAATTAANR